MRYFVSTLILLTAICFAVSRDAGSAPLTAPLNARGAVAYAPRYRVTILEDPKHKFFLEARAINDAGVVVGVSIERTAHGVKPSWHGFLFRHGKYNEVDPPAGSTFSEAVAIDNAGEIAGNASSVARPQQAFVWKDGTLRLLEPVDGGSCAVYAINKNGIAAGSVTLPNGHVVAATWRRNGEWDSPRLLDQFDRAVGVASSGDILLVAGAQSYVLTGGRTLRLGTLGGADAVASALNDVGDIVGSATTRTELNHAFLWRRGTIVDVSKIPSIDGTAAVLSADSINDFGQMAGTVRDGYDTRAMLFDNGHQTNLNHLIPRGIITLDVARAINNKGQIVGQGHIGTRYVSFLLTPLAAPVSAPRPIAAYTLTPPGYKPAGPRPDARPQSNGRQESGA
ncbi:MAG: hypothetical protein P4L33_13020 [Capsulimonadaceae bacterium]|nr:hypothetical protein [Capsulimonadaceae bacterium]